MVSAILLESVALFFTHQKGKAVDNTYDKMFYDLGDKVAGIDESGVSDIAGPLVAACVILPKISVDEHDLRIFEVNDCKKVPEKYREDHAIVVCDTAIGVGIGEVRADEIDYLGKRRSTILAMMRAIAACQNPATGRRIIPDHLLIDGEIELPTTIPQTSIKDGDTKSLSIASASIVAKVYRDNIMRELHRNHPQYGWAKNKGAPCEKQFKGMDSYGVLVGTHRTKFWPFQPNKERRDNEKMWLWRRSVWRQKTLETEIMAIGEDPWLKIEEHPLQQKSSNDKSKGPSQSSGESSQKTQKN